jgi:hypothetical protein
MRIKTLSVLATLLLPVFLYAQPDTIASRQHRVTYFNCISSGALLAKKDEGVSFSVSSIHGIRSNKFFAGLGVGYDAYQEWRMVPLTASIGYDLFAHQSASVFVQLQGGYSLARNVPVGDFQPVRFDSKGGEMVGAFLGYTIKKQNIRLYLMAGYKFQRIAYEANNWWSPNYRTSVKREIERITVQIGFGLN